MKKLLQILTIVFAIGVVAVACEPVEVDEDLDMDDPMMDEEL